MTKKTLKESLQTAYDEGYTVIFIGTIPIREKKYEVKPTIEDYRVNADLLVTYYDFLKSAMVDFVRAIRNNDSYGRYDASCRIRDARRMIDRLKYEVLEIEHRYMNDPKTMCFVYSTYLQKRVANNLPIYQGQLDFLNKLRKDADPDVKSEVFFVATVGLIQYIY